MKRALRIFEESLGEEHASTVTVKRNYLLLLMRMG